MMNGWDMTGWGWVWMTAMMGGGLLLAALVVLLVARRSNEGVPSGDDSAPETILARRLARGEIDEPAYQQRLRALRERDLPREGTP